MNQPVISNDRCTAEFETNLLSFVIDMRHSLDVCDIGMTEDEKRMRARALMSIWATASSAGFSRSLGKRTARRFSGKSAGSAVYFARIFPGCASRCSSRASMASARN